MKSDQRIEHDVSAELEWEPIVDNSPIHVHVEGGVVTLTGEVSVYSQKYAAEEVVKRVHGVQAIANDIDVKRSEHHHREDPHIAAAVLHALEWNTHVPHDDIRVIVEDGWVTLEGQVQWHYQKEAIARAVHHLHGISGVNNAIHVRPTVEEEKLKASVQAALERSATLNRREISIDTRAGGVVVLTGDVHSCSEREEAERLAWSARGVHHVENCVTITPWGGGPAEEWGY